MRDVAVVQYVHLVVGLDALVGGVVGEQTFRTEHKDLLAGKLYLSNIVVRPVALPCSNTLCRSAVACNMGAAGKHCDEQADRYKLLPDKVCKLLHCPCAVRDVVLYARTELGEGLVVAFRLEDRVVAEAFSAVFLGSNCSVYDTLEGVFFVSLVLVFSIAVAHQQCY